MNRALIHQYCEVISENSKGIYYLDGSFGIAEFENGFSYSCNSIEEFEMLTELMD